MPQSAAKTMLTIVTVCVVALLVAPPATSRRPALESHEVWLQAATAAYTTGQAIEQSEVLLVVPGLATGSECVSLSKAARQCAVELGGQGAASGADLGAQPTGRIPSIASAAVAQKHGLECPVALPDEADCIVDSLLMRVFEIIDTQHPSIVSTLFGPTADSMLGLHRDGALNYHSREPAVNVYDTGGEFLPHMDHEALTVLIPLTSPSPAAATQSGTAGFSGGGTGFWSLEHAPNARGGQAPTALLRPEAGTALIFGGHVMHAGLPVNTGTRVCFVASFSAFSYDYDFWGPRPRPASLYKHAGV